MTASGRVDQMLAGMAEGDAISQEAVLIRNLARAAGRAADLFADMDHVSPGCRGECRPLAEYRGGGADTLIHHYGIDSPAADQFLRAPGRKILVYHNITPARYFEPYDSGVAARLRRAREVLQQMDKTAVEVWADSAYNAGEMRTLGFGQVAVLPLLFDPAAMDLPDQPRIVARLRPRLTTILFTGRLAPNKRLETLLEAYRWYRGRNPFSRLVILGSPRSCPRYFSMLRMYCADLDLANVCFEGYVAPADLPTYYRQADLFVSASDHEGYCLPLVEALYCGLPVIAQRCGGMPEALGDAGVLYEGLTPGELGALMHTVLTDAALQQELEAARRQRVAELRGRDLAREVQALLAPAG